MGMLADIPEGRTHGYWLYEELVVGSVAFDKTCFSANPEDVVANTMGTAFVGYETSCQPVGYVELLLEEGDRIGFTQDQEPGDC